MKRKTSILTAILCIAFLFIGCSKKDTDNPDPKITVTLTNATSKNWYKVTVSIEGQGDLKLGTVTKNQDVEIKCNKISDLKSLILYDDKDKLWFAKNLKWDLYTLATDNNFDWSWWPY